MSRGASSHLVGARARVRVGVLVVWVRVWVRVWAGAGQGWR